jgi:hypothetical protein
MVVADDRKNRVVHCIGKANIDELTIAEDLSMLAEGVETLLIGAASLSRLYLKLVSSSCIGAAPRVYSVTIVVKSRILIEGRISHDEVPLDAPEIGLGAGLPQHYLRNSSRSSPVTTVVMRATL